MNSSKQRGNLDDTNARYEQYMSRHETLQQEKLELAKKISLLPQNGCWSMRSLQNWQSTMARSLHLIR